jgi:ribosomal protein S18 acetylase RimI-like enzyme
MEAKVALRPVRPDDLKTLIRMAVAFNDEDGHPLSNGGRKALKALCSGTTHGRGYMIVSGKVSVGYIVIGLGFSIEYGGVDGFLDEFYVEEDHRGRGIGTAALLALNKVARKLKVKAMHLEAMPENDRAAELYRRLGYRLSARRLMSKRY